jgi:hypothetical protein
MKQDRTTKRYEDPGAPGTGRTTRLARIRGWLGMAMDCIWDGDREVVAGMTAGMTAGMAAGMAAGQPAGGLRRAASSAACSTWAR